METVYQKYRPASDILMEYYGYCDLRKIVREDWKVEDERYEKQCDKLWTQYINAAKEEEYRKSHSKSAKVAERLEKMKLTDELVSKIKLRNEKLERKKGKG